MNLLPVSGSVPNYHYPDNGVSHHERVVVFISDAWPEKVTVLFQRHCFFWLVWVAGTKGVL